MPKNDKWQNGSALDTEMDSNGSCDSVVSFNSCFSDDSLEFLSAEERACLTFLEETIQSLDTEDDSGLSNDEPDQIPARGNVAIKAAHLSASIGLNKLPGQDMSRCHVENPLSSGSLGKADILNYMVPTPFVLANRSVSSRNRSNSESAKMNREASQVSSEVNVVVKPPSHKAKRANDTNEKDLNKPNGNVSRRGPLSYEGLVQLRKTASLQKTNPAKPEEHQISANNNSVFQTQILKSKEHQSSKSTPPPVAPKPKIKPLMNFNGAKAEPNMPHTKVINVDNLMNPEKVRLEALCKLGLLKAKETKEQKVISKRPLPPCVTPKPGKLIQRRVQNSIPLHQCSVTSVGKAATLERTNPGPSGCDTIESTESEQASSSCSKSQHSIGEHSIGKDRREALQKLGLLKN